MLQPVNPMSPPFRQWFYDIEGHGRVSDSDERALYAQCRALGVEMSYAEWKADMLHKVCLEADPGACYGDIGESKRVKRLSWDQVRGGINAMLSVVKSALTRGEVVYASQAEADRRAAICLRNECKRHVEVSCLGCQGVIALAHLFLLGREVKGQARLALCSVCGCHLPSKCFASNDVLRRLEDGTNEYPDSCWMHEVINGK